MRLVTCLAFGASYLAMSSNIFAWAFFFEGCNVVPSRIQFGLDAEKDEVLRYCLGNPEFSFSETTVTSVGWTTTASATVTFIRRAPPVLVTLTQTTIASISTITETRTFARLPVKTITTTVYAVPRPTKLVAGREGSNPWYNSWGKLSNEEKQSACKYCPLATAGTTTRVVTQSIIVPIATQIISSACTPTVTVTIPALAITSTTFTIVDLNCTPLSSAPLPTVTVTRSPNCVPQDHPAYPGYGSFLKLWGAAYFNTCGTINPWFRDWAYRYENPPPYSQPWVAYKSFTASDATECCSACHATENCFMSRFNRKTGECVYGARITPPLSDGSVILPPTASCPVAMTPIIFRDDPGDAWVLMQGPCAFTFCSSVIDVTFAKGLAVITPLFDILPEFFDSNVGLLPALAEMEYRQNKLLSPMLAYPWDYVPMCKMLKKGTGALLLVCQQPDTWLS